MQVDLEKELKEALAKREQLLECGANDEKLNDKIRELRKILE